jgi:outer membrane immunogenic protein
MKRRLILGAALLAAGAPAHAADLTKAPLAAPAALARYDWSGFYLGANAGGGMSRAGFEDKDYWWNGGAQTLARGGGLVGAQAGYNWQFGSGVLGVVGDIDWASFDESSSHNGCAACLTLTTSSKFNALATVRARAGIAFDRTLLYVTAGPAFGHIDSSTTTYNSGGTIRATTRDDSWHIGMAVGAGAEFALAPNWTMFGEYLYVDLPESVVNEVPGQSAPATTAAYRWGTSDTAQIARIGLNYKFGGSGLTAGAVSAPSGPWLPLKALPAAASVANWTGFYVGVNAGGGMARGAIEDKDYWWYGGTQTLGGGGAVAGGQIGYDWQSGATVLGVVGDLDWASFNQSNLQGNFGAGSPPATFTDSAKLDALASVRARAGIALDRTLVYVTAGPAFGHINSSVTTINGDCGGCTSSPPGSTWTSAADKGWRAGIAIGGGAEFALAPHLSVFGEYLYYDFLERIANQVPQNLPATYIASQVASYRWGFSGTAQVARVGVNYKFDGAMAGSGYGPAGLPAATANWRGFYIGANVGGGVSRANLEDTDFNWNGGTQTLVRGGGIAGGQAGYDWQWGSGVLGLVADADWASFDTTNVQTNQSFSAPFMATSKLDAFATLRARAGLASGRTLIYVTAGPAFAHIKASATTILGVTLGPFPAGSVQALAADSSWHAGIAVGGGAEVALAPHLSAFGEFLYLDFADSVVNQAKFSGLSTRTGRWGFSDTAQVARLGLNYRFSE